MALSPPSRVMKLVKLVSPWANVTYGGCRYLRDARMETLRKYSVLHEYFKDVNQPSIFDPVLDLEDKEYILMGLSREDCSPLSSAFYEAVALRSWAPVPGSRVPVPELSVQEPAVKWVNWAWDHDRRLRAVVLEWVLTNPTQGLQFLNCVGTDPEFRKVFLGHYHDVEGVLRRLDLEPVLPPMFFLEKIEKVRQELETEQKLLEIAKPEVSAREERTTFLQDILDQACKRDLEVLIRFNSRIPALPPRRT